jgi:hypothetical protein
MILLDVNVVASYYIQGFIKNDIELANFTKDEAFIQKIESVILRNLRNNTDKNDRRGK